MSGTIKDDETISDLDLLFRRLPQAWIVPGNHGRMRISSAAFKHREMSVLVQSLLLQQGRTPADVLSGFPDESLCRITAGLARELGQAVVKDTDPPHDPAHGLVIGKKPRSVANRFAREAQWVIPGEPPPNPD